jgi:cytochrome bd ubiquinol oxidase subunit I
MGDRRPVISSDARPLPPRYVVRSRAAPRPRRRREPFRGGTHVIDTLLAARLQMEVSLAFHMMFAALGIGLPFLMVVAEWRWMRTGEAHYRALARKWGKATALTFAVGAVSGTALSFELGLLWPDFMEFAGGVIGPAFALEGYAFFTEAIFIGLYLYGWERLRPMAHWLTGVAVAVSGMLSGVLVVAANAWMQVPAGFTVENGRVVDANPFAVFQSPGWFQMSLHSTLATYAATGFAVAGVYAMGMIRGRRDRYHRAGLGLAMGMALFAALLQPISGDISAKFVAKHQPAKLAAMEGLFETQRGAPLLIGGLPDPITRTTPYAIHIPGALSFLATGSFDGEVIGLNDLPRDEWPPVVLTHLAFQVMVACGMAMLLIALLFWWTRWKKREEPRWLLLGLVAVSPLGYLALQAGWIVTEVGRQPWTIYEVMRTSDAVTPVDGVPLTFFGFSVLYLVLGTALVVLLRALADGSEQEPAYPDEPRPADGEVTHVS